MSDRNKKLNDAKEKKPVASKPRQKNAPVKETSSDKTKIYFVLLTLISALVISWYYNQYLSSLVNKPLDEPKIIHESFYTEPENLDRYWGTYRLIYNKLK